MTLCLRKQPEISMLTFDLTLHLKQAIQPQPFQPLKLSKGKNIIGNYSKRFTTTGSGFVNGVTGIPAPATSSIGNRITCIHQDIWSTHSSNESIH